MPAKTRVDLKARFETNKIPSEVDFAYLIDAPLNQTDDGLRKNAEGLNIKAEGDNENMLAFFSNFDAKQTATWKISQKPDGKAGFSIAGNEGSSRLFIDEATGTVAIAGTSPLQSSGNVKLAGPGTLQLGDINNAGNGQLLLVKTVNQGANRAYKIGVNDQFGLSVVDLGHTGDRVHSERLKIDPAGRITVYNGLEVNETMTAKNDLIVDGRLEVKGKLDAKNELAVRGAAQLTGGLTVHKELKVQNAIIKWGDGAVENTNDPGLYSSIKDAWMRIATNYGPIIFYNNTSQGTVATGLPSMLITREGNVGIGTDNPRNHHNPAAKVLQIGDDKINGSGEIVFGRRTPGKGDRSFKMGITEDRHFSLGDFGYAGNNNYREYLTLNFDNGQLDLKKTLLVRENAEIQGNMGVGHGAATGVRVSVNGAIHAAGNADVDYPTVQGAYLNWNNKGYVGGGRTHFINHGGTGDGGFTFHNKPADSAGFKEIMTLDKNGTLHLNQGSQGNLYVKGDIVNDGSITYGVSCTKKSDMRVKTNIRQTDGAVNLALLNSIRVSSYDLLTGGKEYHSQIGVIAQELEKTVPEAISPGKAFIADVFAKPADITTDNGYTLLTMAKPHQFTSGDLVKLFIQDVSTAHTVTVVNENTFKIKGEIAEIEDVLVYGKQVSDFRFVKYEHLYTLNLSATQELSKKIDTLLAWKASLENNMVLAH